MPEKKGDSHMKKLIGVILSCLLACSFLSGCAGAPAEQQDLSEITPAPASEPVGDPAGMPNPVVEVGSVDEINGMVGCNLKSVRGVYDDVGEESFSVINGEPKIGEYRFTYAGIPVAVRAGIAEGDISGIYMSGGTTPDTYLTESNPYAVVDTGYGLWTRWFAGGMQYSIRVGAGQDPVLANDGSALEDVLLMFRDYQAYAELPWHSDTENEIIDGGDYDRFENLLRDRQMMRELNESLSGSFGTGGMIPFSSLLNGDGSAKGYTNKVTVSNLDELLSAIASDTEITVKAGDYLLTEASDYGTGVKPCYVWEDAYDGFQLKIRNVSHLSIRGEFENDNGTVKLLTTLLTQPRYALVLQFYRCEDVRIEGLVIGHTDEGECTGAVVDFNECRDVSVKGCELFGCGTFGITAEDTGGIRAEDTVIHSCSYGHVEMYRCADVAFDRCSFFETEGYDGNLFYACDGVCFSDCDFALNSCSNLFYAAEGTDSVELNNCLLAYNVAEGGLFGGNAGKYVVRGGAYVDYSMNRGEYRPIPGGNGTAEVFYGPAPTLTPVP